MSSPPLEVAGLVKHYPFRQGPFGLGGHGVVRAVDGVSFTLERGQTLALVGESGCGKSTVARLVLKLIDPTAGSVRVQGSDLAALSGEALRQVRRGVQIVFQDPYASLHPRLTAGDIVAEPLVNFGIGNAIERAERVAALFDRVGLSRAQLPLYAHQFSGGQRQRIGIARALAPEPAVLVADEPVSALDVSVRSQIVNLLTDLQAERQLSMLFISHDLAVVQTLATDVAVMYLGALVERAPRGRFFGGALHPYSQALLEAVPVPDPRARRVRRLLAGEVPSASALPSGCRFRTRCPRADSRCAQQAPPLVPVAPRHFVACHHPDGAGLCT